MKIAHLISTYLPYIGGTELCVHNLAKKQAQKGHTVKVIAPIKGQLPNLNYEVLPLRWKSVFFSIFPVINRFYFVEQLRRCQEMYKFDIWQVTMGYPFGVAAIDFFKRNNIPCVLRCSGEDIQREPEIGYGTRLHRWADFQIRRNYPRFDALISIVQSISKDYMEIGVDQDKIHYIPNGVNKRLFDVERRQDTLRRELKIDAGKKIILTIGRNHPKKGFYHIPETIRLLSKNRDDFVWLLIGRDNDKIKDLAQKYGVGQFLIVRNSIAKDDAKEAVFPSKGLIRTYKEADIFAFPTLIEGCSNVITEAMASGLPVVSTNTVGVKDVIDHEKTGLLCEKANPKEMAVNIERLLNDRNLYETIRKNSLVITKDLDWSVIADRYINVYQRVIGQKKN